eukprot:6037605-Prymnesium_polylepis.1
MYHGTTGDRIDKIVHEGFRAARGARGVRGVYLTPTIVYAAHPRYARVYYDRGCFYQIVLEVRVKKKLLFNYKKRLSRLDDDDVSHLDPDSSDGGSVITSTGRSTTSNT